MRVIEGDCLSVMPTLEAESVDAVVTDPPYFLGFMNKGWDAARGKDPKALDCDGLPGTRGHGRLKGESSAISRQNSIASQAVHLKWTTEALRVAKPGAYLLAFGGTRTHHRLACAIEDAGWEIRDCLMWLHGQGFPKGKAQLKPAWEPIIMARKKGALQPLNIDGCRIGNTVETWPQSRAVPAANNHMGYGEQAETRTAKTGAAPSGRWPANALLDEESARLVDEQSGQSVSTGGTGAASKAVGGTLGWRPSNTGGKGDTGGASRFFYTAKASRAEREAGLEHHEKRPGGSNAKGYTDDVAKGLDRNRPVGNNHPTVKPLDLMQWLCRLVTPKGGLILDPFCGSGTTGRAAVAEGFQFIGIEMNPEYAAIARARIAEYAPLFGDVA